MIRIDPLTDLPFGYVQVVKDKMTGELLAHRTAVMPNTAANEYEYGADWRLYPTGQIEDAIRRGVCRPCHICWGWR
jgi:hypothetical protein